MSAQSWPVVIVESPYAGDVRGNKVYARKACADCIRRHEVPYASHLFFTQFLNDLTPEERELGLTAGYAMWGVATKVVFYTDRGISGGMARAEKRAQELNYTIEYRTLERA